MMWDDIEKLQSSNEHIAKYVFTKHDAIAEAVLYKYPTYEERTVMCISTQTGCPMGCTFCGTGKFFGRNLTEEEIVSQVQYMLLDNNIDLNDCKKSQIMVMSMGEPVLNYKNLIKSFYTFNRLYPETSLLISTSAPKHSKAWEKIINMSEDINRVGLQFSVHESTDAARNKLVPFKNKLSLDEIRLIGVEWYIRTGRKPYFNYCVHENNTSDADVARMYTLYNPDIWECTLSVICAKDQAMSDVINHNLDMINDFSGRMIAMGYNTRVFNPAGQDDIGGGCGQLWQVQKFAEDNPNILKQSCGNKTLEDTNV